MKTLNIDLETRSGADIGRTGIYRYAEDPDFDILLFGVSIDHGPVTVYDLTNTETIPEPILRALTDDTVIKHAYNASFERICLSYWLKKHHPEYLPEGAATSDPPSFLNTRSWRCSMILASYNGLPPGLEKAGAILNLDEQKLKEGRDLIRYFCCPCKPTKANGGRTWNLPCHAPEKWELFKAYNKRDVEVEMQIQDRLKNYPVPDGVWEEYALDQEINDRGIRIDRQLVTEAIRLDDLSKTDLMARMKRKTGLDNPNSVSQLKTFLTQNGIEAETLGKKDVAQLITTVPENLKDILALRLQIAKSSVRKYEAMQNSVCADGRCRGMFQFLGAGRTGRWAGRLIQLQNLPQNHMKDLDAARELTKQGDYEMLDMLYQSIPQTLSELVRTAFIPKENHKFIVADYSAIEARVIAFLAREEWRIETFHEGKDIYCASASQMFRVPVEKHGRNAELRQKGKIAELALGYGGSVGALKSMGGIEMGLRESELRPLVDMWREANPSIVQYWWKTDTAVKDAIRTGKAPETDMIRFEYKSSMLFIHLPSGRRLSYIKPRIEENQYGTQSVTYMGQDAAKKWTRIESYGPKFVENIVQAISRDILAAAMLRLTAQGHRIVGHVHDEVIIETEKDTTVEAICEEMQKSPPWLPDIELRADGYECGYYMKS